MIHPNSKICAHVASPLHSSYISLTFHHCFCLMPVRVKRGFFYCCSNEREAKKLFLKTALVVHPDKGGDAEQFKLLENERELFVNNGTHGYRALYPHFAQETKRAPRETYQGYFILCRTKSEAQELYDMTKEDLGRSEENREAVSQLIMEKALFDVCGTAAYRARYPHLVDTPFYDAEDDSDVVIIESEPDSPPEWSRKKGIDEALEEARRKRAQSQRAPKAPRCSTCTRIMLEGTKCDACNLRICNECKVNVTPTKLTYESRRIFSRVGRPCLEWYKVCKQCLRKHHRELRKKGIKIPIPITYITIKCIHNVFL